MDYTQGVVIDTSSVLGTLGKLRAARFSCMACNKNLTMETRIRCAECEPVVDLCLTCFCQGKEIREHSKLHKYQAFTSLHFPLFTPTWMAEEELLLLEGLTLYSFGNWPDIADHVGTKSEDECFEHYQRMYATPSFPLPLDTGAKLPPMPVDKISIVEYCKHRKSNKKSQTSNPIKPDLGGYMPQRHEFEFPYHDQAEVPVATVKFSDNDSPAERKIKMDVLEVYHGMLKERAERSQFVVKNDLLKWKQQQKFHRALPSDEDRRLLTKLRPMLQVTTREKFDKLVDGMLKETSLRRAIDYYGELRKEGIRTERETDDYYARARKRGKYQTRRDNSVGPPIIYDGPQSLNMSSMNKSTRSGYGQTVVPLNLASVHHQEILGINERRLAVDLMLTPDDYLRAKEAMIREYCRAGRLDKADAKTLTQVDAMSAGLIFDFLVDNNWIRA